MSERVNMRLPAGATCGTCYAFSFCRGIGVATVNQTSCDWFPVRYSFNLALLTPEQRAEFSRRQAEQSSLGGGTQQDPCPDLPGRGTENRRQDAGAPSV